MAVDKHAVNEKVNQYVRKGQWKNALDEMRKLLAEDKNDPMITLRMGDLFLKLDNKQKAALSYFRTATLFAADGQKAKAAATYKMVLRIDPDYEGVQERLELLAEQPQTPARGLGTGPAGMPRQGTAVDVSPAIELSAGYESSGYATDADDSGGYGQIEFGTSAGGYDEGSADAGVVGGAGFELDTDLDTGLSGLSGDDGYDMSDVIDTGRADNMPGITQSEDAVAEPEPVTAVPAQPAAPAAQPIPLFSGVPRDELWGLISRMKRNSYSKDDYVVREGEDGDSLFIIKKGGVRVVTNAGGKELRLATLGERDFFGEVSFLTGRPRTADIIADMPSEILELTRTELQEVMHQYPDVEASLRMFHESRVEDTLSSIKAIAKDMFV